MSPDPRREQWREAIDEVVREASDEQLAGMVGPDRDFYGDDAIAAAEAEIRGRAAAGAVRPGRAAFSTAAMALGPFWYLWHGMVGRGLLIAAVLVAAALGLAPVARALGVPGAAWIVAVVVAVALYCGAMGERDLAESGAAARAARPGSARREPEGEGARPAPGEGRGRERDGGDEPARELGQLAVVAQVGCRDAAEHTRALLRRAGIDALVTASDGGEDDGRARVLVPKDQLLRARAMIQAFLSSEASTCVE